MFQKSDMTQAAHDLLMGVNSEISYNAIATHCGLARLTPALRAAITSARRTIERDAGVVFETVRGVGLRRLADPDIVRSTSAIRRAINRKATAGIRRLGAVKAFAALPPREQAQATINQTIFAMTQAASALAPRDAPVAFAPPNPEAEMLKQHFAAKTQAAPDHLDRIMHASPGAPA